MYSFLTPSRITGAGQGECCATSKQSVEGFKDSRSALTSMQQRVPCARRSPNTRRTLLHRHPKVGVSNTVEPSPPPPLNLSGMLPIPGRSNGLIATLRWSAVHRMRAQEVLPLSTTVHRPRELLSDYLSHSIGPTLFAFSVGEEQRQRQSPSLADLA